jgi:PAS domain S-box-containing protein
MSSKTPAPFSETGIQVNAPAPDQKGDRGLTGAASDREAELLRRQDVLARFGELAVRSDNPDEILHEACRLVGDALGTDFAKVMELQEDGTSLLVKAGIGWPPGVVGKVRVKAGKRSSEGYALRTGEAVISADIDAEERFEYADFIKEAGVRALVNVIIIGPKDRRPYGLLEVDSRQPRQFTENDTKFLRGYANLIAAAVNRLRIFTDMRDAEARLRASEERFRALVTATSYVVYRMSPDWVELRQLEGRGLLFDRASPSEVWLREYVHPDDQPRVTRMVQEAIQSKSTFDLEHRVRRADGTPGWAHSRAIPLLDAKGEIREWFGTASDVTARKKAEEALRESEERFQQFGAASSDLLWIRNVTTLRFEYLSPAFEAVYGVPRDRILDGDNHRQWAGLIVPEDRDQALRNLERVRMGERVTHEFRIERPTDGEIRWIRNTDFPLHDAVGQVQRIGGIFHDMTEEKATADRMQVLMAELQHRTRNLLAVVRSLSSKTLASSTSLADFREGFPIRLEALSRVNGLLSRLEESDRITIDELIRAELSAHGVLEGDWHGPQVTLHGPTGVRLRSGNVQTLALALHELATNALKYGALASTEGQLSIRWRVVRSQDGRRRLRVEWEESGVAVPPSREDTLRRGYGRELIEQALPYQLKADTRYEIGPDGVRCFIDLPVSSHSGGAGA